MPPVIIAAIPYGDDRDLGRAHNEFMEMLPEDGWGCLLDHDVMFTTREWHRQLSAAVAEKPEGTFTCVTNRVKCPFQNVPGISMKTHDMWYHREIGFNRLRDFGGQLRDVTGSSRTPAGLMMMMSKKAWREAGKFPSGLHYMDRTMWTALRMTGRHIYIIEGLYLYHWHRGGGDDAEPFQKGEWVKRHNLPDGRIITWQEPKEGFPEYNG